jgi:2-polyprenyl-3-methyl-5-hydroxy-6-metoxy-1,4-benzoquinol methylase
MKKFNQKDLDQFVHTSDQLGGPGSPDTTDFWENFSYVVETQIDQDLDPYSEEYTQQQIELYKELSGRPGIDQYQNELTKFSLDHHVVDSNPYGVRDITYIAKHINCVSKALQLAKLPNSAKVLDMGSGWGLSSEIISYCGASVTAVDINPEFTKLNQTRAQQRKFNVSSLTSSFDDFNTDEKYHGIFFYECLHHSVKTWELVEKYKQFLEENGCFIISGEPVNSHWWKHWGLRLDPMSIYCIRKHGWFESGWSNDFLIDLLLRAKLTVEHHKGVGHDGGDIYIAREN